MNPFPLSSSDYAAFMADVGPGLNSLPSWGGVIQWRNRFVLAFLDALGNWRLTDITNGIPVNGQLLPARVLVADLPTTELTPGMAFLYSLPGNIYAVAQERWAQFQQGVESVGETIGTTAGGILAPTVAALWPVLIIGGIVLFAMYGQGRRTS